jgi:DNA helicase HerA-like ATPase
MTRETGTPTIAIFPTQFRDFGQSLIVSSQEPSKIMDSIHVNTLVKIVGNLGSGKDINTISEAMYLNEEEREAIPKLQRVEWIVKLSDRYTKPFMIVIPDYPCDKDVSDEEVLSRARTFLSKFVMRDVTPIRKDAHKSSDGEISEDVWKLLTHVN